MKRERFGPRSERSQRLLDQMELQLEELAAAAGEDEAKAEAAQRPGPRLHAAPGDAPELSRLTCRGGASFTRHRRRVRAAAAASCPRSARTSPRRSMWCRGNGS